MKIIKLLQTLYKHCFIFHFDYKISLLDLYLDKYTSFGIGLLTFDNNQIDRSLFAIYWQPDHGRLWIDFAFINFRFFLY
jgi:hypothetical protein